MEPVQLEEMQLGGIDITDAGARELAKLKNLKKLYLGPNLISEAGLKELKKALPQCEISGSQ